MSDYNDIVKSAMDKGILLDSCGSDERQYWWGLYNDLCGMSVEDALRVQYYHQEGDIDPVKKTNIVNFVMQKGGSGNYTLFLVPTYAPTSPVTVTFLMDGASQSVTIPAGVTSFNTELSGSEPTKPYAEISNVSLSSDDEQYNYAGKNSVLTGIFTITINNDGDVTVENVKYGTDVTLPSAPEKEGYTFTWKDSDGNVITGSTIEMPEKDITITGEYTIRQYVLSYSVYEQYLDENEDVQTRVFKESSVTIDFGVKVLDYLASSSTEREGYSVSKWQTSDGVEITDAFTMPADNLSASCEYGLNKYTVKYYSEGELYSEAEYYFGASTVAPANPTKTGYDFDGWTNEVPEKMPAHDVEASGEFTINSYVISYVVDDEPYSSETYEFGATIVPLDEPEKAGYTFGGWSEIPSTMPAHNVEVNGKFTINTHTITYIVEGETYSSETYDYGQVIVPIAAPAKTGYTFTEWSGITETMPDHDLTVTAVYNVNRWIASFSISGDTEQLVHPEQSAFTQEFDYGETIVYPSVEVNSGYTFRWIEEYETMPDNNISINGIIEEVVAVTQTFYGTLPFNWKTKTLSYDVASVSALDSIDGTSAVNEAIFTVPSNAEYAAVEEQFNEGEISEKEYDDWLKAHNSALVICAPSYMKNNILLTDMYDASYPLVETGTLIINGTEYTVQYHTDEDFATYAQISTEQSFERIIKINS